jgi:hypothetical protein
LRNNCFAASQLWWLSLASNSSRILAIWISNYLVWTSFFYINFFI